MLNRGTIQKSHPVIKFFFTMFLVVALCSTLLLAFELIANGIFHVSLVKINLENIMNDPQALMVAKISQLLISSVFFVVPPFIIAWCYSNNIKKFLSIGKLKPYTFFLLGIVLILAYIPLVNFITDINKLIHLPHFFQVIDEQLKSNDAQIEKIYDAFMKSGSVLMFMFNVFVMAFVPAIGEELFFRGALQRIFIEMTKNKHVGVIVTAIVFSAIHFQFFNFLPRFFLGLLFGYIVLWTGNLWITVLIHFANNFLAVTSGVFSNQVVLKKMETMGTLQDQLWTVIPSVLAVGFIIWFYYKNRTKDDAPVIS